MNSYRYRAQDRQGGEQRGIQDAETRRAALTALTQRGLIVVELEEQRESAAPVRTGRIRAQDRISLLEEMATLLDAGVSLAEAAPSLEHAYAATALGPALLRLRKAVQSGQTLAQAFRQSNMELPEHALTLLESGEAAGRLGPALRDASQQLEYERKIAQDIRAALIYPTILVLAGTLAVLTIFLVVVPRFASLLGSGRVELPAISRWVIGGGLYLKEHLLLTGMTVAGGLGLIVLAFRAPVVRRAILETAARLPVAGPWIHASETGRWATLAGTLLANRVPLLDSLELSAKTLRLRQDQDMFAHVREEIRRGRALSEVLGEHGWIAPTRLNLLRVGERTGDLPRLLVQLGALQTEVAKHAMKSLLTLIEPLAILLIGGVIGFIMIAVIMAITSLNAIQI